MNEKVPYFNAPIYLQNKTPIGKVDEILGPINQVYFSVKMGQGIVASSFKNGEKVYIAGDKLLPLERFLPKPRTPCSLRGILSNLLDPISLAAGESRTHSLGCSEYVVLISLAQNAVVEVREAQLARAVAVVAVSRVEEQASAGDEVPQEVEVALVVVEAAIGVEDAVYRVAVAEDVEEASDSTLISVRCRYRPMRMCTLFSCRSIHTLFASLRDPASL